METLMFVLGLLAGSFIGLIVGILTTKSTSTEAVLGEFKSQILPALENGECFYIEVGKHSIDGEDDAFTRYMNNESTN